MTIILCSQDKIIKGGLIKAGMLSVMFIILTHVTLVNY
jgi:hypothetical protein